MAIATVCFNAEHDMAAITWDRRPNDMPFPAINHALEALYHNDDLAPFLFEVYQGDFLCGILVAGNFNPESDEEIRAVWSDITIRNETAPETVGEYACTTIEV